MKNNKILKLSLVALLASSSIARAMDFSTLLVDSIFFGAWEASQINSLGSTDKAVIKSAANRASMLHWCTKYIKTPVLGLVSFASLFTNPELFVTIASDFARNLAAIPFWDADCERHESAGKLAKFFKSSQADFSKVKQKQMEHLFVNKIVLLFAGLFINNTELSNNTGKNSLMALAKLLQDYSEIVRKQNFYKAEMTEEFKKYCKTIKPKAEKTEENIEDLILQEN